ncbi:MAG: hypothetical protein IH991_13320 [Planctomycetes bacterium]|nr:hypothetical protein [Planctomycetota bacterium]
MKSPLQRSLGMCVVGLLAVMLISSSAPAGLFGKRCRLGAHGKSSPVQKADEAGAGQGTEGSEDGGGGTATEDPKPDAPKPDAPKPDAPKPDAPKPDAPKPDAPKPDAPKPDAPKPDAPKPDAPKPDAPKPDAPKPDAPKPDAPKVDPPKPDSPPEPDTPAPPKADPVDLDDLFGVPPKKAASNPEPPKDNRNDPPKVDDLPKSDDGDVDLDKLFNGENTSSVLPMRRWTDDTGQFSAQGRLIVILDGAVRLVKENGRFCTVPLHRLSGDDRLYVEQMTATYGKGTIGKIAAR